MTQHTTFTFFYKKNKQRLYAHYQWLFDRMPFLSPTDYFPAGQCDCTDPAAGPDQVGQPPLSLPSEQQHICRGAWGISQSEPTARTGPQRQLDPPGHCRHVSWPGAPSDPLPRW